MNKWIKNIILIIIMVITPFLLNCLINKNISSILNIVGDGKASLIFWGSYISSIATAIMAYFTYIIIKQNDSFRQGVLIYRIIYYKQTYCLEIINVGNSVVSDINLNFNEELYQALLPLSKQNLEYATFAKIWLKPNESKYICIEVAVIGNHEKLNVKTNTMETVCIEKGYLDKLKITKIKIKGNYKTINKKKDIDEEFRINDWNGPFIKH